MALELQHAYSTNDTLVGYQSQPDGRGTLTIFFSCLLTLGLCVWSALHLDLPKPQESKWHYTLRYAKWSVVGLFAPEILIWVAWRQFLSARALTQTIRVLTPVDETKPSKSEWTEVHSYFVGMGGFVFDLERLEGPRFIPDLRRLHVTPRGVQLLARCGLLPTISKGDIDDKSKTDTTGKLICCVQVVWFVVSAISRVAAGLPVTPLEVNTLAHIACALTVYTLWWHKPRWVNEPTILKGDWIRPICAYMYMSSQISAEQQRQRDLLRNYLCKTEFSDLFYHIGSPAEEQDTSSSTESEPGTPTGKLVRRTVREAGNRDLEQALTDDTRETRWRLCCEAIERQPEIWKRLKKPESDSEHAHYREAMRLYPQMPMSVQRRFDGFTMEKLAERSANQHRVCVAEELVIGHARDWPGDDLIHPMQGHLMGAIMWSSSIVYGAIHLAGWNERFPTDIELWFWRAAALYVVFSGMLWSCLNLIGYVSGSIWVYWYEFLAVDAPKKSYYLIYCFAAIGGALYFIGRSYLVVEAFASLRALPASAYASPNWILTVPHIG